MLTYNRSRKVLNAIDGIGLSLTRREYYNLKKFQSFNEKDDKSIDGLLFALDEAGFYHSIYTND